MLYIIVGTVGGAMLVLGVIIKRRRIKIKIKENEKEEPELFNHHPTINVLFSPDIYTNHEIPEIPETIVKIENEMDIVNNIHLTLNDILLQETSQETIDFINQEIKVIESLSSDIKSGTTRTDVSDIIEETVTKLSRTLTLDDTMTSRLATVNPMLKHMANLRPVRRASMMDQKTTIDLIREST
jgi:hypothetical protein